jgi:three-Cys-motif partner protein
MNQHRFGGPWTAKKLDALKAYLSGWARALKNQPFSRTYIDAFAGTGDRAGKRREIATLLEIPEFDEVTKGSARIALEIDPSFDRYVFIEKRQRRSSALAYLKRDFPERNIEILTGDANEEVQRICRETDWRRTRAVLFLDPYGMQVSWEMLETVAATKAIDAWMLFPTGVGLNRLLTKDGKIPAEWQHALDRSLGTADWRQSIYRAVKRPNLFGEPTTALVKDAGAEKFEAYLRTIFVGVAPETLPLVNSKRQVMYLLCFACGNPRGVDIAVRIAKSVIKRRR